MCKNTIATMLLGIALFSGVTEACEMKLGGFGNQIYHYYNPCHKVEEAKEYKTVSITMDKSVYFAHKDGSFVRMKSGSIEVAPDSKTPYTLDNTQNVAKFAVIADMVLSCQAQYRQNYISLADLNQEQLTRIGIEYYGETDIARNKSHLRSTEKAACRF